jgi:hypothetical protein
VGTAGIVQHSTVQNRIVVAGDPLRADHDVLGSVVYRRYRRDHDAWSTIRTQRDAMTLPQAPKLSVAAMWWAGIVLLVVSLGLNESVVAAQIHTTQADESFAVYAWPYFGPVLFVVQVLAVVLMAAGLVVRAGSTSRDQPSERTLAGRG